MSKQVENVAETIGSFIQYWGFKSVHGKIWVYIFLSDTPVSSRYLKEKLGISKALLSTSISDLKEYKVIQSAGYGEYGSELFIANTNVFEAIRQVLKQREQRLVLDVKKAVKELNKLSVDDLKDNHISKHRLKTLSSLVSHAQKAINGIIKLETVFFRNWERF